MYNRKASKLRPRFCFVILLSQAVFLQQRINLCGLVDLCFRLLRCRVESQSSKLHYQVNSK